jgi:hypothetical protein
MGHYAAEMMCDRCGNVRCTCPPAPKKPNGNFIVTNDFRVVTIDEFDADPANHSTPTSYGPVAMNPELYRVGKEEFKRRADAEEHAQRLCVETMVHLKQWYDKRHAKLCAYMHEQPWKKK